MIDPILKSFGTFLLVLLFFSQESLAFETWSVPVEPSLKTLRVTNLTSQTRPFWVMGPRTSAQPEEKVFEIPAFGVEEIPMNQFIGLDWVRLLSESNKSFQVQVDTSAETRVLLNAGSATRWKVRSRSASELVIFNQAPFEQKVSLEAPGDVAVSLVLPALAKVHFPVPTAMAGAMITITGEGRIGGFLLSDSGPRAWIPDPAPVTLNPSPSSVYFLLSNKSGSQSYVVALSDPQLIEQARKQINQPTAFLPRILMAKVASGHGNFNRDFSSSVKAPWSWHIEKVFRFAELASQECDGNPELLEETLGPWLQNSGIVCFWNYRVLQELSPQSVSSGRPN